MTNLVLENRDSALAELKKLTKNVKIAFSEVHNEFEDHLDGINENTNEIQANYEYICEVDNKISKLNERIDDIYNVLSDLTGKKMRKMPAYEDIDPLTTEEKNIFLNLYTEPEPISYVDLARKMNMPISLTRQYITNLLEKGIPIQKEYKKTRPFIYLDKKFKNLQAKKNVLKIEQRILT